MYELLGKIVSLDDLLVAPWVHDHHCDHPTDEAAAAIRRLDLGADVLSRRDTAMACHPTQISDLVAPSILSASDLEPLTWSAEYYLVWP